MGGGNILEVLAERDLILKPTFKPVIPNHCSRDNSLTRKHQIYRKN